MINDVDSTVCREHFFAISNDLVTNLETFEHLHKTVEVNSPKFDGRKVQITIHNLPDTNFVSILTYSGVRNRRGSWAWLQINGYFS